MPSASAREKAKFASIQKQKNQQHTKASSRQDASFLIRLYLFAYNVASLSGWSYVLYRLYRHLSQPTSSFSWYSLFPGHEQHLALLARSQTSYAEVGDLLRIVQTCAVLEIAHSVLGLVRSSFTTTAAQVFSRLFIVWGILYQFPQVQTSPFFSSMVVAWCVAEIVRYSVYALAQFNIKLYPLEWLRYTLFYVLYPLGAGSEAFLIYLAIPWARYTHGRLGSISTTAMLFLWPPALVILMSHMHAQRRKFIRGARIGKGQKRQ